MRELMWMAGKAFLIALILTPIIRDIFRSYNLVDRPGKRKVHRYPIPRVGGIAIAIAYGVALLSTSKSDDPLSTSGLAAWQLIPGAAVVFLTGLLDDLFSLRPVVKLLGLVAAGSLVFWSGLRIEGVAQHTLPIWLNYPVTVFWLLVASNAFNLIDGLDGLCAGMGLLASLTLFGAAQLSHQMPLAAATLPLAGALLGFLCYNVNPATVFLGDSGALLTGFLLGCYGMVWTQKASTLLSFLVPLLALSIPLLDVSLSVLRRVLRRKPIFAADRDHIHHRLLDLGLSPQKAVWVLYLVATLIAAIALLATTTHLGRYQGIFIVLFCAVAWLGIHKLGYAEFAVAGRLVFGGVFQRAMGVELRLVELTKALEAAGNDDQWWESLVKGGKALGLVAIHWSGVSDERRAVLIEGVAPAWSFRIALSETEEVEVNGLLGAGANPCDLIGLAEAVRRAHSARQLPAAKAETAASV